MAHHRDVRVEKKEGRKRTSLLLMVWGWIHIFLGALTIFIIGVSFPKVIFTEALWGIILSVAAIVAGLVFVNIGNRPVISNDRKEMK